MSIIISRMTYKMEKGTFFNFAPQTIFVIFMEICWERQKKFSELKTDRNKGKIL